MVHIIHPIHRDQEEGDAVCVREVTPGHVDHLVMGSPAPAMEILSQFGHFTFCQELKE